ncbi:MAG TPA: beta-propeller domain-containing protein [Longimicrobiaceae bacterium]|nr:beta-propeller domain-containing protein [Longimicrobiaceae bacterium]
MKIRILAAAMAAFAVAGAAGCSETPGRADPPPRIALEADSPASHPADPSHPDAPGAAAAQERTLPAFRSEQELAGFLRRLAAERTRRMRREAQGNVAEMAPSVAQDAAGAAGESVTNVQHAGVDEGGIVKVHGDHLVMLRRGRLFTVAIGDGALRPVSAVDAFGPDMDPSGTWYDELLVSPGLVIVIGYSYERGGTEVGLFHLDRAGRLRHSSTYHLRSNDYYSSRNYASRLVGGKLVFYTPLYLPLYGEDVLTGFPALRRWRSGAREDEFRRIVPATRVFRPGRTLHPDDALALHTVTVCDLARGELDCEASAVLGPPGRVFYVSPGSVYVWVSDWTAPHRGRAPAMVYRIPLDGSDPTALGVSGSPVDQFSFLESDDEHLNVLVRADAAGEGMWGSERAGGSTALLRVPLSAFGSGSDVALPRRYRALPEPAGHTFQNRFVGDYLLYGTGSGWGHPETTGTAAVFTVPWRGGTIVPLPLPHGVDRIEAMGRDAVVVGTDGRDLHFSAVRLRGRPEVAYRYTAPEASQGELRSHGFFYRSDGPASGVLGLPVRGPGRPGYEHLFENSASVLFLRNRASGFEELGELAARPEGSADDACKASCVDWYGNARPLFLRGRVFALLGYEIVEGAFDDGRLRESRRVSFAPRRVVADR